MALRNPDDKGEDLYSPDSFLVGGIGGAIVWGIVVDDAGKATCNGCGAEVHRKLNTCSNCGTPVRYPLGTRPQELTPSDLVVLEMMPRRNEELHGVVRVQVDDPPSAGIERLLATALLANEEAGALRLEMVKEKVFKKEVFFGVFTTLETTPSFLRAVEVGNTPRWPTGSLESELCKHGAVSNIISDWIGTTSDHPENRAVKRIMAMMVHRTLMEVEVDKERVLKLFTMTSRYYVLPERTSALVMQRSVRLLEECQRTRPDVHDQLTKDIAIGFARQTSEPSDE